MKGEETIALPASIVERMVSALELLGLKASEKPRTADDDVRDMQEAARARAVVPTWAYRGCVSSRTGTKLDLIVCPNEAHPGGVVVRLENIRINKERQRKFFEGQISGQSLDLQRALIKSRFAAPPENAGDYDQLDAADASRVEGIAKQVWTQVRYFTWRELMLPDMQDMIGQPVATIRHLTNPFGRFELVDAGHDSPFTIPTE